jgi:hypothetical protein
MYSGHPQTSEVLWWPSLCTTVNAVARACAHLVPGFFGLSSRLLLSTNRTPRTLTAMVNEAPTAQDKAYTTQEDTPLSKGAADGVLVGASDPDGDTLTAKVAEGPAHGSLNLAADGSFTYTPGPDFNGADGFEFLVSDGFGGQAVGKASISVGECYAWVG